MRLGFKGLVAVVVVVLLSGFAASVVRSAPGASVPPGPSSSGSSPKVHVIEGFTGTWCTWCSIFDPAMNRYADERPDSVVFLSYHGPVGSSDPFNDAGVVGVRSPFY